jgi:hypothetical protein
VRETAGCGPVYRYGSGAGDGFLGGIGSFCPDTPANRAYLRASVALDTGYDSTFCDQCLTVPSGSLFFFWQIDLGPGCPSGCMLGEFPPHI